MLKRSEIRDYLKNLRLTRSIKTVQNHHTYLPDYTNWAKKPDHMHWTEEMRQYHMTTRNMIDTAQHFTTFPDGNITIGRDINLIPAGIKGENLDSICIEHVGNFDTGKDVMSQEHTVTIIYLNAALADRFNIKINTENFLYHTWFAPKSCPGTNFFGGNNREAAKKNFLPVIQNAYDLMCLPVRTVLAEKLNVRAVPSVSGKKTKQVFKNEFVTVHETDSHGWVAINKNKTAWVSGAYLGPEIRNA